MKDLSTLCTGVGKTSLANTLESFLKSPTKSPKSWSWLSENHPELLCTQVMQLYDGLSINNNEEELAVEVADPAHRVKLVKLKMTQKPEVSVDRGKAPSVPIKLSKRKRFSNWFKGKDRQSPTPESPEAQMSKGPAALTAKRDDYSNDYNDDSDRDVVEDTLSNNNQTNVQVKLVDLGGHTAMVLVIVSFDLSAIPGKKMCAEKKTGVRSNQRLSCIRIL